MAALPLLLLACTEPVEPELDLTPSASLTSTATVGYFGGAFGTQAYVDDERGFVSLGPSALSALGCDTGEPRGMSNTVATVDYQPLITTGVINTRAEPVTLTGGTAARTKATIYALDVLDGLITADVITAVSSATHVDGVFGVSAKGSSFANLRIAGVPIEVTTPPNTRIDLPGGSYVILNEQVSRIRPSGSELTVNMLHVVLRAGTIGVPWDTHLFVGHAYASRLSMAGILSGFAYGSEVTGPGIRMGKSALSFVPCIGTDDRTMRTDVGSVTLQGVFSLGAVLSDVRGLVTTDAASSRQTSTITEVNLLDGLITADLVQARARATSDGTTVTLSSAGTRFVNLQVRGKPAITADVTANTVVRIGGLGTLRLQRVIRGTNEIEVRMIEVTVEYPNPYGLDIGTVITVGVANAGIRVRTP